MVRGRATIRNGSLASQDPNAVAVVSLAPSLAIATTLILLAEGGTRFRVKWCAPPATVAPSGLGTWGMAEHCEHRRQVHDDDDIAVAGPPRDAPSDIGRLQ